jgi:hypothetical protein
MEQILLKKKRLLIVRWVPSGKLWNGFRRCTPPVECAGFYSKPNLVVCRMHQLLTRLVGVNQIKTFYQRAWRDSGLYELLSASSYPTLAGQYPWFYFLTSKLKGKLQKFDSGSTENETLYDACMKGWNKLDKYHKLADQTLTKKPIATKR